MCLIGFPAILFGHLKNGSFLIFFKNLTYRLSEHDIDRLSIGRLRLPSKISSWPVVIVSIQPKIPPLLRDSLSLSFPLLLVFLYPFILINLVHELAYTGDKFTS